MTDPVGQEVGGAVDQEHRVEQEHRLEVTKEASTMALYVAICLLAALTVASNSELEHQRTIIKVVWGTTLGLALAHWFAFRLSSRLVASGAVRRDDAQLAVAQFAGSIVVAILATIPVVLWDGKAEIEATRFVVAAFIAFVGYVVARESGASRARSLAYAALVTTAALVVVVVKNALAGH